MAIRLAPIDRTRYVVCPRGSVTRTLTLSRLLLKYVPKPPSPDVAVMAGRLQDQIETSATAVRARHREYGPSIAAAEQGLDNFVDTLERIRSERLEHWELFDHPTARLLAQEQRARGLKPGEFDYSDAVDLARASKRMRTLLYPTGLDPFRGSYYDQAEAIQTIRKIIEEEDGSTELLEEVIGPRIGDAIDDAHARYQAMVELRIARTKGSEVDLRTVSLELQRAIQNYLIALLAMIRDEDDENVAMLRLALRPVDAVREQNNLERARGSADGAEAADGVDSEAIDELLREQQAVHTELGITDALEDEPAQPELVDA